MKSTNLLRMIALAAVATIGFATSAQAAVTASLHAGNSCAGANSASFTTSGPAVQVSLCIKATAEPLCVNSYRLVSANAGENDRFRVNARAMDPAYNFSNIPVVTFPIQINNTGTGDLGAGTATNLPVAPSASDQLIATLDLLPQATATNASYVISLDAPFSNSTVDGGDSTCGGGLPTSSAPLTASFTLNLFVPPAAPVFTAFTPPNGTYNAAYAGYTFAATGNPAPTFSITGTAPPGLTLVSATGAYTGTPTAGGTYNFTVTASNGVNPADSRAVSITIAKIAQIITFNNPGAQAFNASPIASGATSDSGLTPVLSSATPGTCTVSGLNINFVAAGSCTINADQPGNGNYNAATQVSRTFTINASAPGAPTGVSGAAGNLQGTVSFTAPAVNGGSAITGYTVTCRDVPTSTVTGTDTNAGQTVLSHVITGLANGTAYTCTVVASNISGSGPASVASNQFTPSPTPVAPTFTSPATSPAPLGGLTVGTAMATFNIVATGVPTPTISAGAAPAGLTFTSGGPNAGTATITGTPNAAGTFNYTVTATGTAPPATVTIVITVAKANQTITFGAQAGQTFATGGTFAISPVATASSGLAVSYSSLSAAVCTVSGTTVTIVSAGTCNIAADQPGNANYNAAPQVVQPVVIGKANQTITFPAQPARPFSPTPLVITPAATATSNLAITYGTTTPAVCSVTGGSINTLAVGTCSLTADQAGNANFNAAPQQTQSFLIVQGAQSINFSTIPDTPVNSPAFSLNSFANATSGLAVTFATQTPTVCTTSGLNGSTVTVLTLGTCTIQASQAGNVNYAIAPNVTRSFNVVPPGSVSLTSSANPVGYGLPVTLTANVGGTNPTGTVTFRVSTPTGTSTLCNAVPLIASTATCLVPGSYNVTTNVSYTASYSGDGNNNPNSATLFQAVNLNTATLTASANPLQIVAGRAVSIKALVVARTLTGSVTFNENGVALSGCANVPVQALPGSTDAGVATCNIASITAGTHNYVVTYPHTGDAGFEQVIVIVNAAASGPADYTDMWWAGNSENGWGVSITQHGAIQFAVLYVYDSAGKPIFYAMPGGTFNQAGTAFTGALYQPTSSPFSSYDATQFKPGGVTGAAVGTATFTYNSASTATLTYTINGTSGSKSLQRQVFASDDGLPKLQVNDMWWGGTSQNGWGINIAQQGRVLFPVWYTYDATGKATWYGVPGGTWTGTTFTGDIYTTASSPWLGVSYIATMFQPTKVGTMSINFIDQSNALMIYTVNGVTQTKAITRQPY